MPPFKRPHCWVIVASCAQPIAGTARSHSVGSHASHETLPSPSQVAVTSQLLLLSPAAQVCTVFPAAQAIAATGWPLQDAGVQAPTYLSVADWVVGSVVSRDVCVSAAQPGATAVSMQIEQADKNESKERMVVTFQRTVIGHAA